MSRPPRRVGLLTAWASRANGGVFEAVVAQVDLLRATGFEPRVFALEEAHAAADRGRFGDTPVEAFAVRGPPSVGYAPGLLSALRRADLDILHLHGIWMYPSKAGADWAAATGRPYVISPHGMLDPWITGRGRAKKWLARLGYERRSWRHATLFHALTSAEAADIKRETDRDAIAVVPNAVRGAGRVVTTRAGPPFMLYLGRVHPKKNVEALVQAWHAANVAAIVPNARLFIAGWGDENHVASLERCIAALPAGAGVSFLGPVYGERKAELIGSARFLILASHSEGLPIAMLEGWAAGTPSLMSVNCNLPQGFARGAAIDCGTRPTDIAVAMKRGMAMDEREWETMSQAATALAAEEFSLESVTHRWKAIYCGLLSGKIPARAAA